MIDTHSHILPGLDDGARDLSQTLELARSCVSEGVHVVVCSPHLKHSAASFLPVAQEAFTRTKELLALDGIPLELRLGYEIDLNLLSETEPEVLRQCTFGDRKPVLLLETPYSGWPRWAEQVMFELRLQGFQPVLAHPERNDRFQAEPERLTELARQGIVLQVTVPSLLGVFGRRARRAAIRLVAAGEAALLASDMHYGRVGGAGIGRGAEALRRLFPRCQVELLVDENPRRLLAGEPLRALPPAGKRDTWMARLRGMTS